MKKIMKKKGQEKARFRNRLAQAEGPKIQEKGGGV
jgi:hypothetical protein